MTDVLFVSMPFGPLTTPALGLGLLKASIADLGCTSQTRYFTLQLADRLGPELYASIAGGHPAFPALVGEWLFSGALFGAADCDIGGYVREVLQGGNPRHPLDRPLSEPDIERLLRVRADAPGFVADCCRDVVAHRPKLVCFTSVFQQQVASLALAARIREALPEAFILFGGANCEGTMGREVVTQFPFVDAVVSGEGDLVFPLLVREVLSGRPIDQVEGVITAKNVRSAAGPKPAKVVRDLDALPYPDHDDFFDQWAPFSARHPGPEATLLFETSRGCWWGERHHCTFCGLNGATMAFRSKSSDRALAELRYLLGRYPTKAVSVVDNILDMKYFRDFVPALAELDLGLNLFYEVKANLKKEQLEQLKQAGITSICPGVESLSTPILGLMRKGVTAIQNVQLLKWCKQVGVQPLWNLLWGFPGEELAEYERIASLIPRLTHLRPPFWFLPIRVDRFSPYFDSPASFGIDRVDPFPSYSYIYPTLPPDAVANLAYYFAAGTQPSPAVEATMARVGDEIARWRAEHSSSDLVAIDDGARVTLFDTRPGALALVTELDGIARFLLNACDAIRSENQLLRLAHDELGIDLTAGQLRDHLGPLLHQGFMLEEDGRFLSLAVATDNYDPGPAVLARFLASVTVATELSPAR